MTSSVHLSFYFKINKEAKPTLYININFTPPVTTTSSTTCRQQLKQELEQRGMMRAEAPPPRSSVLARYCGCLFNQGEAEGTENEQVTSTIGPVIFKADSIISFDTTTVLAENFTSAGSVFSKLQENISSQSGSQTPKFQQHSNRLLMSIDTHEDPVAAAQQIATTLEHAQLAQFVKPSQDASQNSRIRSASL